MDVDYVVQTLMKDWLTLVADQQPSSEDFASEPGEQKKFRWLPALRKVQPWKTYECVSLASTNTGTTNNSEMCFKEETLAIPK